MADDANRLRQVGVVLFDGFEVLDVFGPLEVLGGLPDRFGVSLIGPTTGPVVSAQQARVVPDRAYSEASAPDIVLVPGGRGTRSLVSDGAFLAWLAEWASHAEIVSSVCTGSGVLAAAGLLDGYRATSNKRAFAWARDQGPAVEWIPRARWVQDRDRWTSSGVAAGIDMALALVAHLYDTELAQTVADRIEVEWHQDPSWDPFAVKNGLVGSEVAIRDLGGADMAWAEGLIGPTMGGSRQARKGEVVDALGFPGLVAEMQGRPVGMLTYDNVGGRIELVYIEVEAGARATGVGTALLDGLIARVRSGLPRARQLWLVTTNDNLDALRFYQKRGFRITDIRAGGVADARRQLKPEIPEVGSYGIDIRDEIELERTL